MNDTGGPARVGDYEHLVEQPLPDRLEERGWGAVWRRMVQGAGLLSYWLSLIFAIPALILTVAAVASIAFGLGSGFGLWIPTWAYWGPGLLMSCGLGGILYGALVGLFAGLIRLITPRPLLRAWVRLTSERRPSSAGQIGLDILPEGVRDRVTRTGRPVLYRILSAGAVLTVVAIPVGLIAGFVTWKYLEARIARAEAVAAADTPLWRIVDFDDAREAMPDEENSAFITDEVAELLPDRWPGVPEGEDPKGPAGDFDRAFQAEWGVPTNRRLDPDTARIFRAELAELKEAVELARTLAGKKMGHHDYLLGRILLDTPLPQSQDARQAPRLLQIDAAVRSDAGDIDGAIEDCRAMLGAARSIGDEPFAISMLVRMSILSVAKMTIERTMAQGQASAAVLQTLQAEIAEERAYPHLLQAMRGERGSLVELVRRMKDNELSLNELGNGQSDGPPIYLSSVGQLWFHYQYAVTLEWGNDNVAIAHAPIHEYGSRWRAFEGKLSETARNPIWGYLALMPSKMWPAMGGNIDSIVRNQAFLATTEVYLAAERHRLATGAWPATIEGLAPKYLKEIPRDPYNGGPLGYKLIDDRLIVHTIGPDLKDQGGEYDSSYFRTKGPDDIGITGWLPKTRGLAREVAKGGGKPDTPTGTP